MKLTHLPHLFSVPVAKASLGKITDKPTTSRTAVSHKIAGKQPNSGRPQYRGNSGQGKPRGWFIFPSGQTLLGFYQTHPGQQSQTSRPTQPQQPSLLGRGPTRQTQAYAAMAESNHTLLGQNTATQQPPPVTQQPPWRWFNTDQQPTSLPQLFNTMTLHEPDEWVMDTGAVDHVHANKGILDFHCNKHDSKHILVGNGSKIHVIATGHASFPIKNSHRPLHLNNILVYPSIIKNIISVSKFTRHNKCSIEFDPFGFTVKDLKTKEPLIRYDSDGPLYTVTPPSSQVFLSASSSVWHQ